MQETPQAVAVEEAAALLHTSADAIRKRLRRGTLDGVKGAGGVWSVYLPTAGQQATTGQDGHEPEQAIRRGRTSQTSHQAQDVAARLTAMEAENTILREALEEARQDRESWREQATQLTRLLDQQQQLALPTAMRDMPALPDPQGDKPGWWERFKAVMTYKF